MKWLRPVTTVLNAKCKRMCSITFGLCHFLVSYHIPLRICSRFLDAALPIDTHQAPHMPHFYHQESIHSPFLFPTYIFFLDNFPPEANSIFWLFPDLSLHQNLSLNTELLFYSSLERGVHYLLQVVPQKHFMHTPFKTE